MRIQIRRFRGRGFRFECGAVRKRKLPCAGLVATDHALEVPEDLPAGDLLAEAVATEDAAFHQARVRASQSKTLGTASGKEHGSRDVVADPGDLVLLSEFVQ